MQNMEYIKASTVILAVLLSSSQVHSNPKTLSKRFQFNTQYLVTGKNHLHGTTLAYALCESDPFHKTASCKIKHESNVFNDRRTVYTCDAHLSSSYPNGEFQFIGVELWGDRRVIFTSREDNKNNLTEAIVNLQTFDMRTCKSATTEFAIHNRPDMKNQLFILPLQNRFVVSFMNKELCENAFCKLTMWQNGAVRGPETWYYNVGEIYTLEGIEFENNNLLIALGESDHDYGDVKYCLLDEARIEEFDSYPYTDHLAWTSSNNIITICNSDECKLYNYHGELINTITLDIQYEINEFIGLYNLPRGGHLAVICNDEAGSNVRFIRIGENGEQLYDYSLKGSKCSETQKHRSIKFLAKNNVEYCVSLFQSVYTDNSMALFAMYCFTFEDEMDLDK